MLRSTFALIQALRLKGLTIMQINVLNIFPCAFIEAEQTRPYIAWFSMTYSGIIIQRLMWFICQLLLIPEDLNCITHKGYLGDSFKAGNKVSQLNFVVFSSGRATSSMSGLMRELQLMPVHRYKINIKRLIPNKCLPESN